MKALILTLLLLAPAIGRAGDAPRLPQVVVSQSIRWNKVPTEHRRGLQWGYATVLYFGPDGKFGMVDCVLNREGRSLVISRGDGLNIYVGRWWEEAGVLKVDYRLMGRTTPQIGEELPGRMQTAAVALQRSGRKGSQSTWLSFLDKVFMPDSRLPADEVRSLCAQYWQG